jgi:phenylacetate-CoA ligase
MAFLERASTPPDVPPALGQVRGFGQMLAMTQWLSPDELRASQASLLPKLLLHARKTTKFYKERLAFDLSSPESIEKAWSEIPILTRAEAVKNILKLISSRAAHEVPPVIEAKTSGSTGMPFVFKKSAVSHLMTVALTERMQKWWSVDGAKVFGQVAYDRNNRAPPPDGLTTRAWHSLHPEGVRHFLGHSADIDSQLQWLAKRRPDYLGSSGPILKELALAAKDRGMDLKFALIMSYATMLDEETRELCRAAFGAEIADTYGAQEVDHIAAQCPDCGEYHISAESVVLEVLRADGSAASPGEIGRVIVTPLHNHAMPLVRYELGDMAEVGTSPPACRRKLPTLRRILGRYRNMFRFRDGSTAWPSVPWFKLQNFLAFKQFQIVQTDPDHIEIRYVPKGQPQPFDLAALTERVRTALRQPVVVSVRVVDQIERSANGKFEDCISLVRN